MKLSIRPHRAITSPRAIAAFAAASCAAAVLAASGTAAAASPLRLDAAQAPSPASAAAAAAHGRIAFSQWDLIPGGNLSGHSNVYTINPDGTSRRQLTHVGKTQAAGAPDWSPDGTKIAYESNQAGDYRIWVMNSDGSGQSGSPTIPASRTWSPPGPRTAPAWCSAGATITSASSQAAIWR